MVHITSRKALREFWSRHPDSEAPLARWFKIVASTDFRSFDELRATFPAADQVGDLIVFNIGATNIG